MPSTATKKKVGKVLVILFGVAFFLSFALSLSFYYRGLPHNPQPEIGRIYPLNNHGYLLYMTRQEDIEQRVCAYAGLGLFVLMLIVNHLFQPFEQHERMVELWQKSRRDPWDHRWGP